VIPRGEQIPAHESAPPGRRLSLYIGVHMNYLSSMPLDYQAEIARLRRAQTETTEALDEAAESGDNQFAIASLNHYMSLQQELDRLRDER